MSLDDLLDDAGSELARMKVSREEITEALGAGAAAAIAEGQKIRAGTNAQRFIERVARAFAAGAASSLGMPG